MFLANKENINFWIADVDISSQHQRQFLSGQNINYRLIKHCWLHLGVFGVPLFSQSSIISIESSKVKLRENSLVLYYWVIQPVFSFLFSSECLYETVSMSAARLNWKSCFFNPGANNSLFF